MSRIYDEFEKAREQMNLKKLLKSLYHKQEEIDSRWELDGLRKEINELRRTLNDTANALVINDTEKALHLLLPFATTKPNIQRSTQFLGLPSSFFDVDKNKDGD